jgi:hypothetical protein
MHTNELRFKRQQSHQWKMNCTRTWVVMRWRWHGFLERHKQARLVRLPAGVGVRQVTAYQQHFTTRQLQRTLLLLLLLLLAAAAFDSFVCRHSEAGCSECACHGVGGVAAVACVCDEVKPELLHDTQHVAMV